MTTLTLLSRAYNAGQLEQIEEAIKSPLADLNVETKILGTTLDKWVQVSVSGEDEKIATNYITKNMGTCPVSFDRIKKFSTLKGYITSLHENDDNLCVDVGIFEPKTVRTTIPLARLQAQLVDGRKAPMRKIIELYGFIENLPISVKVIDIDEGESRIEAELSTGQIMMYETWRESLLDRLFVIGASQHKIEKALSSAMLERDVISIETLGAFEHSLTCKLGTDAVGLIYKIGRKLKSAKFAIFNPKKFMRFMERQN
jgi:hypothetical protein